MTLDEHYICQRAANAIISEIGPFRVSTDALQAINQFLDEFIVLLLTCSLSLDLSEIKSIVFSLLPSSLGKNAIVEAELEVKTFTETESIDYELYERMRNLGSNQDKFPLTEAIPLLREKCFEYCTLADKDDQLYLQNSIRNKRDESKMKVVISPIVAIYITTIMEHIAEYLLTAVAMTAEHEETDYVRVKQVFLALIDDIQLGDVFQRMDLRDKMEKRAGLINLNKPRNSYLPPPSPTTNRKSYTLDTHQQETGSFLDLSFDDLDLDFEENRKSTATFRPHSVMSTSQQTINNRKSTFHLFKNNRNSFSGAELPRASSPIAPSVYDPDAPSMNFDDLIKSGGTVKVSLTPNRLRSIEVKDQTKDELTPPPLTWERRSTSSPRLSTISHSRPSSPLVRPSTSSRTNSTSKKSTHSLPTKASTISFASSMEVPKLPLERPSSPLSISSKKVAPLQRFENPRDAPKPPTPLPSLSQTVIPVARPVSPQSTPEKPTALHEGIPTSHSNDSIASTISSVLSMPSPITAPASIEATSVRSISIQEPALPRPSMVMRRSSVSNKKSRENLRRAKEEETPLPTPKIDDEPEETKQILSEEPVELDRQVHFDKESTPPQVPENEDTKSMVGAVIARKKAATLSPERPSSMVAKRASMVGNHRRRSLHENHVADVRHRGSVSVSIKQWDDISSKSEQVIPPAAHRRSVLRQLRQQQQQVQEELQKKEVSVLDKVLKFERASSLDDVAHQRVSHMPRRERFLYLQQDPSAIERKSTLSTAAPPTPRIIGIDQGIQTDLPCKHEEERGLVDGDEEWFLQDDEWDEQEESSMVEWLLGE